MNEILFESLTRYIGQTVTIFTTSGGLSGSGFSGVLAAVTPTTVRLITDIGAAPACPIGSCCVGGNLGNMGAGYGAYGMGGYGGYGMGGYGGYGFDNNGGSFNCGGFGGNLLGSVTEIPVDRIASFTHNAIA